MYDSCTLSSRKSDTLPTRGGRGEGNKEKLSVAFIFISWPAWELLIMYHRNSSKNS